MQNQIESTILIARIDDADKVMHENRPRNVTGCFALSDNNYGWKVGGAYAHSEMD